MPFTFAHPAILLPLYKYRRKWFSVTGLVTGSLAPDFELFIKMRAEKTISHSLPGLFLFVLPMAVVLSLLYHGAIKQALANYLPHVLGRKLQPFTSFNWLRYLKSYPLLFLASVLIGGLSHLAWDSFTHDNGVMVRKLPFLQLQIKVAKAVRPFFATLYYASTIIGILVIAKVFFQLPNGNKSNASVLRKAAFWVSCSILTVFVCCLRYWYGKTIAHSEYWYLYLGEYLVILFSAMLMALTLASFIFYRKEYYRA